MLECYLDDSGTHGGSRVITWGGVAGDKKFFEELEIAWEAQLAKPCDGRPRIKAFHSADLAMGSGEFVGYSQAERDLTRWNFRKIIIDCGLTIISYGISVDAWEKVSADSIFNPLRGIFSAEGYVFACLFKDICKSAKTHGDSISFQFDKGRFCPELVSHIKPALEEAGVDDHFVRYAFSPVKNNMGLQAADLIAHETYKYFSKFIDNPNSGPSPHLHKLIEGVFDSYAGWFGENEIRVSFEGTAKSIGLIV